MKRSTLLVSLAIGSVAGFLAGQLFLAIGVARHGEDLARMMPSDRLIVWILARSIAVYGLLGAVTGILCGALLHGLTRVARRGPSILFEWVLGLGVSVTAFAYLTAWHQIEVMKGLPLAHPDRLPAAFSDTLYALLVGGATTILGAVIARYRGAGLFQSRPMASALSVFAVIVACFAVGEYGLQLLPPDARAPWRPSQVVVVGIDAATLRVMGPMMRAGELPTFRRLIEEGAWGSYLTYGLDSSPVIWTSMATGKRVREHGITDFVSVKRGAAGAEPVRSTDRRVKAIWNILSELGQRVGVVDWLITYPPEEVNGYMVSRLQTSAENQTHPPELNAELARALSADPRSESTVRGKFFKQIDLALDTAEHLMSKDALDMVFVFEAATDAVQHQYWKYYEPEKFDKRLWEFTDEDVRQLGTLIPDTYSHLDRRLGEMLSRLDPNALLLVVSDHGQLAHPQPSVWFRLDRLLAALGQLEFLEQTSGTVNFARTRAYTAVESRFGPAMGVNINVAGREPTGLVGPTEAKQLTSDLAAELRGVRLEDGTPVFGPVIVESGDAQNSASQSADITVTHSRLTRSMEWAERRVRVGKDTFKLSQFLEWDPALSGNHDRQGVIFIHGKGVRKGFIGQRVLSTSLQEIVWRLTDKVDALDSLLPVMRRIGLLEQAMTLDLTPTILYALGLPVAADMSGRPLSDVVITGKQTRWVASYEGGAQIPKAQQPAGSDEELMERLKALGYIH